MSSITAALAVLIVQTYFSNFSCVYNIGDENIVNTRDIVVTKASLTYALNSDLFEQFNCAAFVISSDDSAGAVEQIEHKLRFNRIFSFNVRYYLLIHNEVHNVTFNATSFFKQKVFDLIVNVLLLVKQNDCVYFYTHSYKGKSPLKTIFIGKLCDSSDISSLDLYPNKQDDLMGRELTISTFTFVPYVYLEKNGGFELAIMDIFIKKHNYTKRLITNPDSWGTLYDNFTGLGAQWDVFQGLADIAAAGYFMSEFDYKVDASSYTARAGLNFLVPRPKTRNGLTILLQPFPLMVWIVLLVVLITVAVAVWLSDYTCYNTKYSGLRFVFELGLVIFAALLQQRSNLRMRFYLSYGGILLVVAFYNSGFSSLMTKRTFEPHVDNGPQLEQSDLLFIVPFDGFLRSIDIMQYPNMKTTFTAADAKGLQDIFTYTTHVAIVVDHLNLGYGFGEYDDSINITTLEKFMVLKEDMALELVVYVLYKNSVILPILDDFIRRMRASGLHYHYQAESFRILDYEKQVYMQTINQQANSPQYFNIKTLSGAFLMLLVGLFLSTLLFLCEMNMKLNYIKIGLSLFSIRK